MIDLRIHSFIHSFFLSLIEYGLSYICIFVGAAVAGITSSPTKFTAGSDGKGSERGREKSYYFYEALKKAMRKRKKKQKKQGRMEQMRTSYILSYHTYIRTPFQAKIPSSAICGTATDIS